MEYKAYSKRSYIYLGQLDSELIPTTNGRMPANGAASLAIRRSLPKGRVPHVCIIGAGFAGLRCADVLSSRGIEITILEGRDRIGGRVSPQAVIKYRG